ncbi:pectinesterase family protein [Treponema pectinovorum]|uniref:pectinesterase family protein n=1 Tax=Treponema pectinovorum TaxID=164 RepID=UPI0011CA7D6B|nr:pectinesterase family protein [Treponema pectinovorum]
MVELKISPSNTGVITHTFKKISEMVASGSIDCDTPVHLVLAPGIYPGVIAYNLSNPLIMEGASGSLPQDVVISAENCEAFHKDTENRAVFVIGMAATEVTLRGFTIENTHIKTCDDVALGNQAEALCFHNQSGSLLCQNMRFISRQDTIHVKGFSRFENCYVTGDVDYIWGYCDTSVWVNCNLHTRQDNRGDERPAFVLQSRALNSKPGFVFVDCNFTADKRSEVGKIWIARTEGTGKPDSVDRWDSIALIDCTIDENYEAELWTDEGGSRAVFPEKGSMDFGWREWGTLRIDSKGNKMLDDTSLRNTHVYIMTKNEAEELKAKVLV